METLTEPAPATTFDAFKEVLRSTVAHRVGGEVFPFEVPPCDLRQVIAQSRDATQARIASGRRGDRINQTLEKTAEDFCMLLLEDAIKAPVHISLFELGAMREEGGALHGVVQEVYLPLARLWREAGLAWQKVYPILFLSGPGCSTNYHWDPSSVLVVQLGGRKRFHSLKDPGKWCPDELVDKGLDAMVKPAALPDDEVYSFELGPGDAVWSPCRAPHWVDAYDETAYTLSIAFTDIAPEPDDSAEMVIV